MPLATFQNKVFNVSTNKVDTFYGMVWGGSLDTETQEKLDHKPSTYVKGSALDSMAFEIPLRADFGHNVRKKIDEWEEIKTNAKPDIFTLGSKPLGKNKWLLISFAAHDLEIDGQGRILRATLKLQFEEYVREGVADFKKSGKGGVSLNLPPSQYIFDPPEKVEEKRHNPNIFASIREFGR